MNLGRASYRGDAAGARKAVEDGADVNAAVFTPDGTMGGTRTAAHLAAWNHHGGVLGVLLADPVNADPDKGDTSTKHTPLHAAFRINSHGNLQTIAVLLAHGADANRSDMWGMTPCMYAAATGKLDCTRVRSDGKRCLQALAEGAARQGRELDVNAVNAEGETALDIVLGDSDFDEVAIYLRDELGALRAADLPPSRKPPKSASKKR